MKTIIAGSRTITDYSAVLEAIERSGFAITEVVSGGARGVDNLGARWAVKNRIHVKVFLPDWDHLGKKAGMVRNHQMAHYAEALIAIWNGYSPGTGNMIETMQKLGKAVHIHTP